MLPFVTGIFCLKLYSLHSTLKFRKSFLIKECVRISFKALFLCFCLSILLVLLCCISSPTLVLCFYFKYWPREHHQRNCLNQMTKKYASLSFKFGVLVRRISRCKLSRGFNIRPPAFSSVGASYYLF